MSAESSMPATLPPVFLPVICGSKTSYTEYSSPDRWEIHNGPEYLLQTGLSADALLDFASPSAGAGASSEVTQHSANTCERPAEETKQEDPQAAAEMETAHRQLEEARVRRLEQELAALRAETDRLRRATAAASAGAPAAAGTAPPAANADNEAAQFLQFMRENQALMAQQNQALIDALTRSQNQQPVAPAPVAPAPLTKPQIEFPKWDGSEATKADFLFRINTMKNDTFFNAVNNWSRTAPGLEVQNNYLQANIVDNVPLKHRSIFADDPLLAQDGFAMLDRLLVSLKGDTVENRLLAITELAAFEYTADDTTASYMARLHGLQSALRGCTIDQFITLIALARMDPGLYPGITNLFLQGDTALLNEDLGQVERQMERQDRIRSVTGVDDASARWAKPKGKSPTAPSPAPAPSSDKAVYPPSAKPSFQSIVEFIKDEAKKLYGEIRAKQKNNNEKGRKAAESAPPPADNKDKKEVEQAKRATSVEPPVPKQPMSSSDAARQAGQSSLRRRKTIIMTSLVPTRMTTRVYLLEKTRIVKLIPHLPTTLSLMPAVPLSLALSHPSPVTNSAPLKSRSKPTKKLLAAPTLVLQNTCFPITTLSCRITNAQTNTSNSVIPLSFPFWATAQQNLVSMSFDSGAFLLFPNFTIKVDDRVDCLLNFKPIGRSKSPPIEYAEPRQSNPAFDSARPAHLIPSDDSDDATILSQISCHVPTPKSTPSSPTTPAQTPPEPRPSSPTTVITDLEVEAHTLKPLSNRLLSALHTDPNNLPPMPPSYTAGACETRTEFVGNSEIHLTSLHPRSTRPCLQEGNYLTQLVILHLLTCQIEESPSRNAGNSSKKFIWTSFLETVSP
eukprot:scaffold153478_cov36-Cyclotella_meneghiniana.AAC.2